MKNPAKIHCAECENISHSFFCYCTPDELDALFTKKIGNVFKKGQIIFFEGNYPLGLYCIKNGAIKLYKTGAEGKELILRISSAGDFLGYRAIIGEETYSSTAEALEETTTCFVHRNEFLKLLEKNPALSKKLTVSLCHDLELAYERVVALSQKTARERVSEILLLLHQNFARQKPDDARYIGVQLPREDIANLAALTTETVIRLLSEFKDEGLIEMVGKKIMLNDRNALKKVARI